MLVAAMLILSRRTKDRIKVSLLAGFAQTAEPQKTAKVTLEMTLDEKGVPDDSETPEIQWGRRDLNPEPTDYESAALTD